MTDELLTYTSCTMILAGAVIMSFSIIRYRNSLILARNLKSEKSKLVIRLLTTHLILMGFFLIGYVVVGYGLYMKLSITGNIMVGSIFLFGAIFVFLGIKIQDLLVDEITKHLSSIANIEKMAAVGKLSGGLAHEINNPMTVILGYAQTISAKTKDDDPIYKPIKAIEKEAVRCRTLINELLAFSRVSKTKEEPIDINKTINGALIPIQEQIKKVNIVTDYDNTLPEIRANKNQIQQVITNLCANSLDAMPKGGIITVSTKNKDNFIEISVSDTGTGIPKDIINNVFEPFFTTKEVGKGTGLGLSLCYEIIKLHKGEISIKSVVDKGTTVTIQIPSEPEDNTR